ncbi:Shortage in chiasmata [Rhynchospora pubera]|uniref:Shortage in chiasmata n=1 Tax=Rhynchospora pubera TaxID=906938 RepID=A0AAV8CVA0_9POAL|nr:Shortage in chiasmata [Rhynchospora pubera]
MRTRFLSTDYFFSKSENQTLASSLFAPLYLPAPDLVDPCPERGFDISSFVSCNEVRLESNFGGFPINKAVADLFSDLVPQFCQVEEVDRNDLSEKELADFLFGESKDAGFRANHSQFKIPDETQFEKKLHFEILELDTPQSKVVRFCKEEDCVELCFGLSEIKIPLDKVELDIEITIPYQEELLESIYEVKKVPFEFDHVDSYSKKDTSCAVGLNSMPKVPQFELKDFDWDQEYENLVTKTDTFNSLLPVMELCSGDHKQEPSLNLKELLPSPNFDILSYISKQPEIEPDDEAPRLLPLNSVLEMDLISLNDKILVDKTSAVYVLNHDGTHSDFPCVVLLPKVEMMDLITNDNSRIFSDLQPTELDTSEELLRDDMDQAKKFYESIVSSELALVDDTFKSLPTPVLSDEKIYKPCSKILQELLCAMDPHSFSASDGIYLDWHLLIQGTCERDICSRYKIMVEDVNASTLTAEQEILSEKGHVVDIIALLEVSHEKLSIENHKEVLSEPHFGVFKAEKHVSSTKEIKAQVQKEEYNGDKRKKEKPVASSAKASMLFESMSQNSDLKFFLGARRDVAREGIAVGDSRNGSCISMEPTKAADVVIEPTQPFAMPKEPTKAPDVLVEATQPFSVPNYLTKAADVLVEPIQPFTVTKYPTKAADVLIERTQPFTMPKEPTIPITLKEPSVKDLLQDSNNFLPTKEKGISTSSEPSNDKVALNLPFICSRTLGPTKTPLSGVVVVVNTQCLNKPMLVSRRSSYQKILALEKEGAHVVERDINLPLDLAFSAGVCLVWYETGAFGNLSTNLTDGASCIQMFMENIATSVLMSLSYSFNSCVMIFEGEGNLLAAVMDQSDTLYSAAANLDMNLQLLCSYNPESTDEIILSCITRFTGPTRGLYPGMPESETLAESFLTKFPSINPFSAHAILSTGGTLIDFLEWSNERRIQAVGKYLVPDESIALFSALCKYGETGESKSVMTDCSSVDSDINSSLLQSPLKRQRFANETFDVPMDGTFFSKPLEQFQGDFMELPRVEDQPKKSISSIIDQFVGRKKGIISSVPSNFDEDDIGQDQLLDLGFNENMAHSRDLFAQEQAFMSEISSFSLRSESRSKLPGRSSLPEKGPEFGSYRFRTFPTSGEMEDETTSNWVPQKIKCMPDLTGSVGVQRDVLRSDDQETKYPGTSSKQGLGWKFEFLGGGGGEKRSSSSSNSSSKQSHCHTRSPSIIDSFRYQGSKVATKKIDKYPYHGGGKDAINPLRQKWKDSKLQQTPIPISEKRKTSAPLNPSWTPVDKRARQNLSFTRYGKERQSKLVWRKKDSPCISTSLGKRPRGEGHFRNL